MNIIARNALSPWSSGFKHKGMTFRPATLHGGMPTMRLAQAATPAAIPQATRDQTLQVLNDAWLKASAVDSWRSQNPDWQMAMQKDGDTVAEMTASAAPLMATATKVRTALQNPSPTAWTVTQQEITDANTWATFINGIYGLIAKHSTSLTPVSSGATPAAGALPAGSAAKTDYTIPIAIGAGALLLGILFFKSRGD
jgi:hypothetical protein